MRSDSFNLPVEGFVQDQPDLNNEMGLSVYHENNEAGYEYLRYITSNNFSFTAINNPGYPILGRYNGDPTPAKIERENLAITTLDGKTPYEDFSRVGKVYYLDNYKKEVTEIYKDMLVNFIKDKDLNQNKFAVDSRRNEITRVFCIQADGVCQEVQRDRLPKETFSLRTPGNARMAQGSLPQVMRGGKLEQDVHNLNAVNEAKRWDETGRLPLLISQSSSLGIGSYGFVSRMFDDYTLTDDDLELASNTLVSSSLFGLPMASIRF